MVVVVVVVVVVTVVVAGEVTVVVLGASAVPAVAAVPAREAAPPHPASPAAARAHANADAIRPAVSHAPRSIKRTLSQSGGPARLRVSAGFEPVVERLEWVGPPEGGLD